MRTGEGMTKKMNRRSIAYIVSVVAILLVIAAVLTVFFTVRRHEKLLDRRDKAIAELTARRGEYDESRIVLADTSEDKAKALADRLGAHLRITKDGRFAVLSLPEGTTIIDVYAADENLGELSSMSADYRVNISELSEEEADTGRIPVRPQHTVSDSAYNLQTYLDYLNLKNVWNYTCASGITVAIIDTGIDTDHPEFAGRISEYSYNATEDKIVKDYTGVDGGYDWSLIEDEQGHGTAVAGVIGASMNSGAIVGVAPEVTLLVIKAECDESGAFKRTSDLVFGLYYAIERDVNVVNMSFGINSNNPFAAATQLAVDSDIICVAAAGNDATASLTYPAADPNVFGVGALEADGWNLASYSNYGENVNFVAPGTVYTTKMGGGYGSMNGTSFASPITAGVMALYLSQNRYSEFITVREILYASCYDLGDLGCDWYYGYGALDVSAFILEERGTVTFNMLTDELENTKQTFIRSHTLQSIPEPERLYAIFDGWYYDPQCTDEYNLYSDKFVSDLTLYANWVNEEDGIPYTYVELPDGTIEIRSYTGHRRYLTIPDYIDGKVVSSIGVGAFEGETRIREINLPKYLVRIRDNAFAGCNNLLNIKIPDTVTEISVKAFYDDVRLSYVAFGEGSALTKIEPYAFGGCSKLTRFELPASLTDVNGTAFFGTTSMTAFTVAKGSKTFTARDGVLMNIGEDTVICYPAGLYGEYKVPDSVSMIGVCAFACSKITQIDLNKAEYIGSSAFMYSSLESLIIPDGVKLLGDKAFASCYRLRAVKLGAGLTNISSESFAGCSALPEIEIPANIVSIGGGAFFGTYSMTKVTFAEGGRLSEIAFEAFAGSGLVSVEIPASVTALGGGAFSGCSALSAVTFGEGSSLTKIEASTFSGDSRLSSVTLPESIVYIGRGAFAGDISLTEITLPSGLVYLGDFAFEETGLVTVAIPKTVETFGIGAFASCHSLTDINVDAENAKYIDIDGVVYDRAMTTLIEYPAGNARTSYTLADGIVTVGQYAFCGSWNLQRVTLSQTVETVDEYAFYDCRGITSYTLSDVLTYIKRYAFAMNSSLRSMAMPDSLMQISNYAFIQDWSLSSVTFTENSRLPRISFGAFAYCGLQSFRVPASVSTMAQGAFIGCSNLYSFTFAAGSRLESISAYMFDGCTNLRTVTFESGSALTSIQAHGFEGMRKLTSVDFGDAKVTNIDNFAFRFCESLKNFTIPDGVTFLGRYAFYYCTALESVTVPASMDFIGRYAFLGTNKISIYFAAETLPPYLAEDWDHGIAGYYLGVTDVVTDGDWKYAKLTDGGIAILGYSGTDTNIDLTALDFGGNIVNIGGSAFEYSAVESIRLPETLITIQARAFYHSALKSINIPAGTEFIGREAFSDTPIETLTFADGAKLTVIERSAFENTKHLGSVIIPASLRQMGRAAFKNSGITALAFADGFSLAEIPEEAFAYTAITAVRIPDSVTLINHGAFRNTADLETVTFGAGENLTLGSNAFYSSGLKTLEIPTNMTYIGEYAFVGLGKLGEFKVAESNPYYKAVDGLLVSKSGRKLIAVPAGREGSLTLPVGIEVIGFGAFESSKLSQILFIDNANILSLGYRAFFGMKNIREISIPASVVAIDYYAFANCTALEKVTFAEENLLRGVYEGAFYGCKGLREISLPDSVVEISDFAFYGCRRLTALPVSDTGTLKGIYSYGMAYTGLTELNLPETIVDIDSYAFKGTRLKSVTIPDANAKQLIIGIGAFEDCNELEEITLPFIGAEFEDDKLTWLGYIFGAGSYEANSTYVPESLKKVTISEGITSIGEYAFYQLLSIEEISVPHSVTTIYWEAFSGTTAKYELTNTITGFSFGEGLTGHLELSDKVKGISENAFHGCSNLTSITIPDSVTSIGSYAFAYCSSLTGVYITDIAKWCGISFGSHYSNPLSCANNLYLNGKLVENLVIPDSVTSIGGGAFSGCTSLKSITIPDSVTSIGGGAFSGCTSLKSISVSENSPNYCSVDGILYDKAKTKIIHVLRTISGDITIPDSVTSIDSGAFSGCSSLTSITIPDSVTSIGDYAFYCSSLTNITIGSGVTSIGKGAFEYCTSLTSITIPKNVTNIGGYAFRYCSSLTKITIGGGVTSIGDWAFYDCSKLYVIHNNSDLNFEFGSLFDNGGIAYYAKLIIDKNGNKRYRDEYSDFEYIDTTDGFRFIKEYGVYRLIAYLGKEDTITLPKDINGSSYTISNMCGVRNVIILDGVTSIGSGAFDGCTSLKSIMIPDSVTSIDRGAFSGCSSLTGIAIPNSVTSIGTWAFSGCTSLKSITIPDSVTSIGDHAFYNCSNLASITIGSGVTSIDRGAFSGCSSLTSITIPDSVKDISDNVFAGCPISEIKISEQNENFKFIDSVLYDKDVTSIKYIFDGIANIEIPATVIDIGTAFNGNKTIQTVNFEKGSKLKSIGNDAFYDCSSLTSITIPDSVTSIGNGAFYDCSSLTSITIGSGVASIGANAFAGCSNITSIAIPDSVTSIGGGAFWNCTSLKSIMIPDSVTSIGNNSAFSGCSSLTSVTIGNSVTSIGEGVFSDCSSLTSITIPDSVTSIGNSAFSGCSNLTNITIPDSVTSIGNSAFSGCRGLTSITIPDSVTSIGNSAFSGCRGLTSITIPDSVTSIGSGAFSGCTSLKSISVSENNPNYCSVDGILYDKAKTKIIHVLRTISGDIAIPDSVTSIDSGAFSGCTSLKSISVSENNPNYCSVDGILYDKAKTKIIHVLRTISGDITIPDSVTSIDSGAFSGCSSLTSITIPDSVTSIGDYAFYCSSLTSITIPDSVTSIGDYAFYCSSLTNITIGSGVTSIGWEAFSDCRNLYAIHNNSDLNFEFGSHNNGEIAYYAKLIVDKNGNKRYKNENSDFEYIDTADGFRFIKELGAYRLIAYFGKEDVVTLPTEINGNRYTVYHMASVHNVIIPYGVTSINSYAFSGCTSLKSIAIPDSVTSIGSRAFSGCTSLKSIAIPDSVTSIGEGVFSGCSSLTSITIPDSVTSINSYAFSGCTSLKSIAIPDSVTSIGEGVFSGCSSLTSITIPDSVTSIGRSAFYNTAYYNNPNNWENGTLHIGNHLIKLSKDATYYISCGGAIAHDALKGCYKLKKLTMGGDCQNGFYSLTNLETLVITKMPMYNVYSYFGGKFPIALKNIVLTDGVRMRSNAFSGITGVTIYVAANEKDVRWDENFPGWNNGNKVVYGDKWITADFYDKDGNIISSDILLTSQIVRQPYVASMMDDTYYYEFLGWDIDGDGIDDVVPATSSSNISARAVYGKDYKCVAVGHSYIDVITPPTLDSEGFTTHTCSVCGDEYIDSYVDKLQYIIGDVNGDRAVNKDDAIHLLMHIFYPDVYPVNQNCDFDGNGIVDTDDAIYLLMHISFPDAYPIP